MKTASAPIDFFNLFCDNNFFVQICQETNFYNVQQSTDDVEQKTYLIQKAKIGRLKKASEIKRTIGVILYMGICKLPNRRMSWGSWTALHIISESMTRNRFEDIVSILGFNDNKEVIAEGQDGHNKLHKIQPLIDHFKTVFTNIAIPETYQATEEMMLPFKDRHRLKMSCQRSLSSGGTRYGAVQAFRATIWFWSPRGKRWKRATCKCISFVISLV